MAIIKQLKTFLSKTKIYPKTLTKAVYNDDGTSLHEVVKNALYADDDGEIVDADPRDADTLGGKYTADILDTTFQMAQQFMTSIDIYKLNWGAVTEETIGGVNYKVMWPIAPDGTNDVYGLLITTNGQLGLIRNNKGSKSTSITNYNANTIAGWVTGSSTTQTKTVSYSNYSERAGTVVLLNWYNANTYKGLVKMNVNSQGAKDLYLNGQITSATNYDIPKGVYVTYFDGTKYYMRTDGKLPIPQIEQMESDVAALNSNLKDVKTFSGTTSANGNLTLPNEYKVNNCNIIFIEAYGEYRETPVYGFPRYISNGNWGFHFINDNATPSVYGNSNVTVKFLVIPF